MQYRAAYGKIIGGAARWRLCAGSVRGSGSGVFYGVPEDFSEELGGDAADEREIRLKKVKREKFE